MQRDEIRGSSRYRARSRPRQSATGVRCRRRLSCRSRRGHRRCVAQCFVSELLKAARTEALPFKEVLRRVRIGVAQATRNQQTPWESSSSDLVINEPRASQPAAPIHSRSASGTRSRAARARPTSRPISNSYPNGSFAALARARLQQIEGRRPDARAAAVSAAARPSAARTHAAGAFDHARLPAMSGTGARSRRGVRDGLRGHVRIREARSQVSIRSAFYIGRTEVRFDEWDACVAEGGCAYRPDDRGLGRGKRPVTNVDWNDAKSYALWLSQKTGSRYRLPTESKWEYAARAGSTTAYPWGPSVEKDRANCVGCNANH